ncbi:unnamed protein product [Brassicogethes aeneus]|uniref:Uncharacterized protein n=1 Tax=Brassicogethes aeneus TaxID=1431903 RepID=A0A9P0FBU8_BRAAE|nr:unnamed protein product [Brassicogethes aeneus]
MILVIPPELHFLLGTVNTLYNNLLKAPPEVCNQWTTLCHIQREVIHEGSFTGNSCKKLLINLDYLDKNLPINLLPYMTCLKAFNDVTKSTFKVTLDPNYKKNRFKSSFLELGIKTTPKILAVIFHVQEFCEKTNLDLVFYSEQASKAVNSDFAVVWVQDIFGAQTVSIMLNGEESELTLQNSATFKEIDKMHPPDGFVVLYSVVDKASFLKAEAELTKLQDADLLRSRPAILVANKIDLARSRAVSTQDGRCLACTFRAKFMEISVGINHNVDELLAGILTQIRLKVLNFEDREHQQQWYKSRGMVKASMKARQMFTWLFGKEDSKFKNCENLHIL